jgi:SsrA-binding protein
MKKPKPQTPVVVNRRARFDYELGDDLTVGMALAGPEVRLVRDNHAQLRGSYVAIRDDELWLYGLTLGAESARNIKLLATKRQIAALSREKQNGLTIVPVKLLPAGRHIKLVIAVARGKKKYDKRLSIKKRDLSRENKSINL